MLPVAKARAIWLPFRRDAGEGKTSPSAGVEFIPENGGGAKLKRAGSAIAWPLRLTTRLHLVQVNRSRTTTDHRSFCQRAVLYHLRQGWVLSRTLSRACPCRCSQGGLPGGQKKLDGC